MIQFACKRCGKYFERPNEAAGTLVFCECGLGNRVPWESTVPRPATPSREEPDQPRALDALPAGAVDAIPVPPLPRSDEGEGPARSLDRCLNHPQVVANQICADCGELFCPDCSIAFRGRTLCGPCKNFRIRSEQRTSRLSILSLLSLLIGLLTGGLFCIAPAGVEAGAPVVGYIGLIIPLTALVLGILGLREVEAQPRVRGRSLAIAGLVIAGVGTFLTVLFILLLQRQVD
jgi:hypothetical protein